GTLPERVEQAGALSGGDAVVVQEGRGGLAFAHGRAIQDGGEIEPQHPLLRPFVAVQEQDLGGVKEQHPAGRLCGGENVFGEDGFKIGGWKPRGVRGIDRLLRQEWQGERVGRFARGFERLQYPQFRLARTARDFAGDRDVDAALEFADARRQQVAQPGEEAPEPLSAAFQPRGGARCATQLPCHLFIGDAELLERFVGRLGERGPPRKQFSQVAFQNGVNVMLRVKLVLVGDARERHRSSPRNTAARRRYGWSSVVMESRTHVSHSWKVRSMWRPFSFFLRRRVSRNAAPSSRKSRSSCSCWRSCRRWSFSSSTAKRGCMSRSYSARHFEIHRRASAMASGRRLLRGIRFGSWPGLGQACAPNSVRRRKSSRLSVPVNAPPRNWTAHHSCTTGCALRLGISPSMRYSSSPRSSAGSVTTGASC